MSHAEDLARRYVHIWNEADPAARRAQVAALWIENGTHYVRTREVHGHADLEVRVATSHQTNAITGSRSTEASSHCATWSSSTGAWCRKVAARSPRPD